MTETIGQSVPNFNDSAFFPMVFSGLIPLRTTVFGTVWLVFDVSGHGFRHGLSHVWGAPIWRIVLDAVWWQTDPALLRIENP
jgi:hypothetical protein